MDLIVGLPKIDTTEGDYSKILVAIDRFSTRTFLIPCLTNVTASLLANNLWIQSVWRLEEACR